MREIKFRGKALGAEKEWAFGYLVATDFGSYIIEHSSELSWPYMWIPVDPETVGQYTGVKDRSGKEIYKDDIIRYWGYEVSQGKQIRPERRILIKDFILDGHKLRCAGEGYNYEVVGNIHDNPELLERSGENEIKENE